MQQFRLLDERRFGPLFAVLFLGAFNDNMLKFAVILFAAFHPDGGRLADTIVTLAAAVLVLPWLLFSALAGQLADKYEKHLLVRRVKLAEVGIMVCACTAMLYGQLELMVLALFLSGVQSALFAPLKFGLLPQYLSARELVGGNGLVHAGTCLAILLGTAACGQLMEVPGAGIALAGAAMILAAGVGWLASLALPVAAAGCPQLRIRFNPAVESMRILRIARDDHPGCIWNLMAIGWFWMAGSFYLSILPLYLRDTLQGSPAELAALFVVLALGAGTGALLCERLARSHSETALIGAGAGGIAVMSIELCAAGIAPSASLAGAGLQWPGLLRVGLDVALLGLCGGLYVVPLYARLQRRSAHANRARILAAAGLIDAGFVIAAGGLAAVLAWAWGLRGWSLAWSLPVYAGLHAAYMLLLWRYRDPTGDATARAGR